MSNIPCCKATTERLEYFMLPRGEATRAAGMLRGCLVSFTPAAPRDAEERAPLCLVALITLTVR